jgi:hypothetical protein
MQPSRSLRRWTNGQLSLDTKAAYLPNFRPVSYTRARFELKLYNKPHALNLCRVVKPNGLAVWSAVSDGTSGGTSGGTCRALMVLSNWGIASRPLVTRWRVVTRADWKSPSSAGRSSFRLAGAQSRRRLQSGGRAAHAPPSPWCREGRAGRATMNIWRPTPVL